jgi:hypothetical protein
MSEDDATKLENTIEEQQRTKWPQPPLLFNGDVKQYQDDLYKSMKSEYQKHLCKIGRSYPYNEIRRGIDGNLIKMNDIISSSTEENNASFPDFEIPELMIVLLRNFGMAVFIPIFDNYSIQINKNRFFVVNTLSKQHIPEEHKMEICIKVADYITRNRRVEKGPECTIAMTLKNNDGLVNVDWENKDCMLFKENLRKYVKDMKWSTEKQHMWEDHINAFDETSDRAFYVTNRIVKDEIKEVHLRGTKGLIAYKDDIATSMFISYLQLNALISAACCIDREDIAIPDENNDHYKYQSGMRYIDIEVISKEELRHISQPKNNDDVSYKSMFETSKVKLRHNE